MSKSHGLVVALALGGAWLLANGPVRAQDADRPLLSTFCDAADIAGSTCKRAKGYPSSDGRACDVKLSGDRYSGKFIASGDPILVVAYESGCEPHATDSGGAIVFELTADKFVLQELPAGFANQRLRRRQRSAARYPDLHHRPHRPGYPGIRRGADGVHARSRRRDQPVARLPADRGGFGRRLWRQYRDLQGALEIFRRLETRSRGRGRKPSPSSSPMPMPTPSAPPAARGFPGRSNGSANFPAARPMCRQVTRRMEISSSISSRGRWKRWLRLQSPELRSSWSTLLHLVIRGLDPRIHQPRENLQGDGCRSSPE